MAIVILFVLNFPRQLLYIWGVLPVPAWALGIFFVVGDLLGFAQGNQAGGVQVANIAHLAGAGFAFIYFRSKLNLGRFVPSRLSEMKGSLFRPKLRIHDPEKEALDLGRQVDAILEKISREGEDSLTKKERRTLEEASRRYQQRRASERRRVTPQHAGFGPGAFSVVRKLGKIGAIGNQGLDAAGPAVIGCRRRPSDLVQASRAPIIR